ncbi:MAG: ATP-binding protein [Parvibaculum sp.]|uniref:ATP-binding protein n=1 Tax=Parvibaculum sp. TaxID=2024848 RepID=UPI0032633897
MAQSKQTTEASVGETTIFGGPTKRFFVSMLPRDIALDDAILDLVDNCVDGAMRKEKRRLNQRRPFEGYYAKLSLSSNGFEIADNCGGIPNDYIEGAFSLGRSDVSKDRDLPTIGMYGIGMKRAVFKIGNEALVQSNSDGGFFEVEYTKTWLNPENQDWELPIRKEQTHKKKDRGVTITITDVRKEVGKSLDSQAFLNRLKDQISEHFGYLIQRGFRIDVNGNTLKPKTLHLKYEKHSKVAAIRPYDLETKVDGVSVKVTVGFFRPLARESEIDEELEGPRDQEAAGVTIVCNDRVVLLADRTMKTGWGDGGVPRYHPQFRAIAALVVFSSSDAEKLPISTTKRDLDVGSDVYLRARKALMEGLKIFTDFTNKWKGMEEETEEWFQGPKADAKTGVELAVKHGGRIRGESDARRYVPELPLPRKRNPSRRISFIRNESDIIAVSKYLYDEPSQKPSVVGEGCFDRVLKEAKSK